MITTKIDGNTVELRNLQEQVEKNKADIEYIVNQEGALNQFGLKVVGQVDTIGDMPTVQAYKANNPKWEYGDAFMVGASTAEATVVDVDKAILLVLTRANTKYPTDFWMNLKEFPKPGPVGPQGPQGEQGIQGEHGLDVTSGNGLPTTQAPEGTTYINATTGDVYRRYNNIWQLIGNIKGATGSVGPVGPQGNTGPIGPQGATGPQGPRGIGVNILGTLTSTSQLPNPTTVEKDSAYIIPADGVNHLWVIEGTDNLVWTDFGTAGLGEKGDKGADGVGINTMTDLDLTYGNTTVNYDTVNGMTINGQARFTYDGGTTKDVPMDIDVPVVAGEGIIIGKKASEEKVEVKLDTAFTDGKYVPIHNTGSSYTVYGTVQSGGKIIQTNMEFNQEPYSGTIVQRAEGGVVKVGTAVADNDAMPKKQVEDNFAPRLTSDNPTYPYFYAVYGNNAPTLIGGSLGNNSTTVAIRGENGRLQVGTPVGINDATTKAYVDGGFIEKWTPTDNQLYVYAVNQNGEQIHEKYSNNPLAWSIVRRNDVGQSEFGTPTADAHAATKAYVDGLHHYTHIISLVGSSNNIYITIAAKGCPNPITVIDDDGSNPSLYELLFADGLSAKAMATGLVTTEVDGSKGTVVALYPEAGQVMVEFIVNGTLLISPVLVLDNFTTITDVVV